MSLDRVHKGDIGRKIIMDAGEDLTDATVIQLKYVKPDGTTGYWSGSRQSLQYAFYITQAEDDLDQVGKWLVQLYVEIDSSKIHGKMESFQVYKRTEDI